MQSDKTAKASIYDMRFALNSSKTSVWSHHYQVPASTNAVKLYYRKEHVNITKTKEPIGKMRKQNVQTAKTIAYNEEQHTTVHFEYGTT